jgi:hypothetical protein
MHAGDRGAGRCAAGDAVARGGYRLPARDTAQRAAERGLRENRAFRVYPFKGRTEAPEG